MSRGRTARIAARATIVLAFLAALIVWQASADRDGTPHVIADADASLDGASSACGPAVLGALRQVAMRVYHEGISSEMTATARHFIVTPPALRAAVERGDPRAARKAVEGVLATGHLTNLRVLRNGRVLAALGSPAALAPVGGALPGARGAPVGSFLMSVWSDSAFLDEVQAITGARVALRAGGHSVGGSLALSREPAPGEGRIERGGLAYRYTSFPARIYPAGRLRVFLLMPLTAAARLCGRGSENTVVKTISRVAALIYAAETGPRAALQVNRVAHDPALLRAVAHGDRAAIRRAIVGLLNQHVVRLRVSSGPRLLGDVGGPFVLGPRQGTLRSGGRTIGSFVLSIQDDLGYRLLADRMAGLEVMMHAGGKLVMSSLGSTAPPAPPAGAYRYRGHSYRVYTLHATAFPSGPLLVSVLIPIPYS